MGLLGLFICYTPCYPKDHGTSINVTSTLSIFNTYQRGELSSAFVIRRTLMFVLGFCSILFYFCRMRYKMVPLCQTALLTEFPRHIAYGMP